MKKQMGSGPFLVQKSKRGLTPFAFRLDSIAIIGLGLMGGSLAAACRRKFPRARIVGVSRSRTAIAFAKKKRWIHEGFRDLNRAVKSADLIVLCTPVDTFPKLLQKIDRAVRPGTLVTDVGSVKGEIARWTGRRKLKNIRFVGAHPMVGSHERGIEAASDKLFEKGYTFVVPHSPSLSLPLHPAGGGLGWGRGEGYAQVKSFWRKITRRVIEVSPEEHDRIVAQISHLPHAVAACLVLAAPQKSQRFAASGFRDATRVAAGDPSVWLPIFRSNRKALRHSLAAFEKKLKAFRKALAVRRDRDLRKMLTQASQKRRALPILQRPPKNQRREISL